MILFFRGGGRVAGWERKGREMNTVPGQKHDDDEHGAPHLLGGVVAGVLVGVVVVERDHHAAGVHRRHGLQQGGHQVLRGNY